MVRDLDMPTYGYGKSAVALDRESRRARYRVRALGVYKH
jgi:hypothetical protein